jgi:predicted membrane protein
MKELKFKNNNINSWLGLIVIFGIVVVLFIIIQSLYKLFFILAPVFILLSLILDYRVIAKFGILLYNLLKHKTTLGILAVIFSVIGLPFVAAAMFFNSFMNFRNKIRSKSKYTKYIELEAKKEEFDLKEKPEIKVKSYEDLFE